MISAQRTGDRYAVAIRNGRHQAMADTCKNGIGGEAGMRPHELVEAALAACLCITVEMAAQRDAVALPPAKAEVALERSGEATVFRATMRFARDLTAPERRLVEQALDASPVRATLGKPIRFAFAID